MATLDPDALKLFQFLVFTKLEGAVTSGMIHLGDRLGLYRALAAADGAADLDRARRGTGLDERWVREWAYNQAAAKLVSRPRRRPERFSLTPEGGAVLAAPDHEAFGMGMFHRLPQTMPRWSGCRRASAPGSATTTTATARGRGRHRAQLRAVEPGPPAARRRAGARRRRRQAAGRRPVADVGCGAGGAVLLLAEAFPASTFTGYDISQHALARAADRLAEGGLPTPRSTTPRRSRCPTDRSLDLVTTFDCIHDMTDPQG